MFVFYPLSFLTLAISLLHVNCEGHQVYSIYIPGQSLKYTKTFTDHVRHGGHDHAGQWSNWSSWSRERECLEGLCVGNNTETTTNPCNGTDRKKLPMVPFQMKTEIINYPSGLWTLEPLGKLSWWLLLRPESNQGLPRELFQWWDSWTDGSDPDH